MIDFLRRLVRRPASAGGEILSISEKATLLAGELRGLEPAEIGKRIRLQGVDERFLESVTAAIGELAIERHGGQWHDDPVAGIVVERLGGVEGLRLHPEAVVARCIGPGTAFDLAQFFESLEPRIDAERAAVPVRSSPAMDWDLLRKEAANEQAALEADRFRAAWRVRFRQELPFTLLGVRELDQFLRSHFLVSRFPESEWARAGFFLGEVGRGLFGGDWELANARAPHEAALHFPELDYLPIGRIYRMMTERPTGDPLDEYLRLIPSARSELRKQATKPLKE